MFRIICSIVAAVLATGAGAQPLPTAPASDAGFSVEGLSNIDLLDFCRGAAMNNHRRSVLGFGEGALAWTFGLLAQEEGI